MDIPILMEKSEKWPGDTKGPIIAAYLVLCHKSKYGNLKRATIQFSFFNQNTILWHQNSRDEDSESNFSASKEDSGIFTALKKNLKTAGYRSLQLKKKTNFSAANEFWHEFSFN